MSEANKNELKTAKESLSKLQKSCKDLVKKSSDLKQKHADLDAHLVGPKSRSNVQPIVVKFHYYFER